MLSFKTPHDEVYKRVCTVEMTVSSIKRRILEYGKSKRSGKRAKSAESNSSSFT